MKKMKVLIVGSDLKVKGGMVSVIRNYIDEKNWSHSEITYIPSYIENSLLPMLTYYLKAIILIQKHLMSKQVDLVHLHMSERGSFYRKSTLIMLCKLYRVKIILHHHGAEFENFYLFSNKVVKRYIRYILNTVDLNLVLSHRLVPMLQGIQPKAKVKVLYNAVRNYPNIRYNPLAKGVLILGRLGERKGTYDLLRAIRYLDQRLPKELIFYLCGDGEIDQVEDLVIDYRIEHRIGHIGWIDAAKKEEILKDTMIHVLPSYNEGLPMSILETMAYGIPNISTRIASIPEVILHEKNGYLIEPGDLEALAIYIEKLVKDTKLRTAMSQQAYRMIQQRFSIENHMERLEQYYKKVINNEYT